MIDTDDTDDTDTGDDDTDVSRRMLMTWGLDVSHRVQYLSEPGSFKCSLELGKLETVNWSTEEE